MTIIQKLSDRDGFIFEAIKLVLVNGGPMDHQKIQWILFQSGVYIKRPLLIEAMKTMKEKGLISKQEEAIVPVKTPKIIVP